MDFKLKTLESSAMRYINVYVVPRNSPFAFKFEYVLNKFLPSGLTSKWKNDICDKLPIRKGLNGIVKFKTKTASYILGLFILIAGFGMSLVFFSTRVVF